MCLYEAKGELYVYLYEASPKTISELYMYLTNSQLYQKAS
jgi:hypothetical protein